MSKSLASKGDLIPVNYGGGEIAVGESLYQRTPYVVFASTKSPAFADLSRDLPGLQDGDPVIVTEPPVRLNPFRFYLIDGFQHWSILDGEGKPFKTTLDKEKAAESRDWKEHVETLLIVVTEEGLVPARCTFKTTKTNAAMKAVQTLRIARDAEAWGGISPAHKATLGIPQAWARFLTTVTLKRGTSRSSGFAYVAANAFVEPTGVAEWKQLADAFKDAAFKSLADATHKSFMSRVAEIKVSAK